MGFARATVELRLIYMVYSGDSLLWTLACAFARDAVSLRVRGPSCSEADVGWDTSCTQLSFNMSHLFPSYALNSYFIHDAENLGWVQVHGSSNRQFSEQKPGETNNKRISEEKQSHSNNT